MTKCITKAFETRSSKAICLSNASQIIWKGSNLLNHFVSHQLVIAWQGFQLLDSLELAHNKVGTPLKVSGKTSVEKNHVGAYSRYGEWSCMNLRNWLTGLVPGSNCEDTVINC